MRMGLLTIFGVLLMAPLTPSLAGPSVQTYETYNTYETYKGERRRRAGCGIAERNRRPPWT